MKELSEKGEKREKRERERSSIRRYTIHTHQHIIFFVACLLLSFFLFTFLTSSLRTIDTSPPSGLLYPDSSTLLYALLTPSALSPTIYSQPPPHLSLPPVSLHPPRKGEHRGPEKVKRDIGRGKKRKEKRKKGKREGEKTKKKKKETLYPRTIAALLLRCT